MDHLALCPGLSPPYIVGLWIREIVEGANFRETTSMKISRRKLSQIHAIDQNGLRAHTMFAKKTQTRERFLPPAPRCVRLQVCRETALFALTYPLEREEKVAWSACVQAIDEVTCR